MSSMMVAPRLQMSDAGSAPLSEMTSGATASERERGERVSQARPRRERELDALQLGVPLASLVDVLKPRVALIACRLSETPKSDSLMLPFLVPRMLAAASSEKVRSGRASARETGGQDAPLRSQCTTPWPWR